MTEPRSARTGSSERGSKKSAPKKKPKKKFSVKRMMIWMFFTGAVAIVCAIIGYLLIALNGERILAANQDEFVFAEASTIYDANGNEITKLYRENREYVEFSKIPKLLRDAFVATEDKRFYEHNGVDFFAIGRALVKDVIARSAVEGGSTITQQLAKNMFLSHEKTFFRKASEASIAVALENKKSKDQILEMYLNRIYFGKTAYGIQAASELYFGKENLEALKIWEIATLAGMPKAPSRYNPISNPEKSQERMAVVLSLMVEQGLITQAEADEAKAEAAKYEPPAAKEEKVAQPYPAFIDYVINEAERVSGLTEEQLRLGGYKIYTTLNTKAQQIVEKEFADPSNFEESVDDQIVQGAMIIIDHRSGEVQAIGGGRDYQIKGTNRVLDTRQPGSAFKPITVYGPALETGEWFPWSTLRDDKKCYGDYCPTDSNRVKYIGPVSMEQSIKESRNASAVWLLNEIGIQRGLDFAKTLGFNLAPEDRNLAVALGGLYNGVTPMQMATAYGVFANGGKSVDPHAITRIETRGGGTEYEYKAPRSKQLIEPETAYYMTDMLQSVVEKGGTGTRARIDRPVAGKTGTTQHGVPGLVSSGNRDAWFVGYTPEWSAAVWMGYVRTDAQHVLKQSSAMSAAMFGKVMGQAMEGMPVTSFDKPSNVKEVEQPPRVGGFSVKWSEDQMGVQISWSRQSDQNLLYNVYRKESSESQYTLITQTSDTSVLDQGVMANKTYVYYVVSYNSDMGLEGEESTKVSITVPEPTMESPSDLDEPENMGNEPIDDLPENIEDLPDNISEPDLSEPTDANDPAAGGNAGGGTNSAGGTNGNGGNNTSGSTGGESTGGDTGAGANGSTGDNAGGTSTRPGSTTVEEPDGSANGTETPPSGGSKPTSRSSQNVPKVDVNQGENNAAANAVQP
ncbi:PBP1A family penicillin-binding protein [Paenibacillus tarimensis]|uniref:PBP1A family penicillin-binding protein n=1 Tax=Paenibacillus tarimensis TaxID=416012 RepID=UPI001F1BA0FD|nr:penicillin-binding protein 1A [Paenibacillus tarimensis]MCF2942656.1 PBP1A family penicillin-binding protein [Paenibacillus tarimensis]